MGRVLGGLVTLAAVCAVGVASGCAADPTTAPVSRADLERQVAGLYPPKDEATRVAVSCDGGLAADPDATQLCHVQVDTGSGAEPAAVRVTVVDGDPGGLALEAKPVVPALQVAEAIRASLVADGYAVDSVSCTAELSGVVGAHGTCSARPANDRGMIEATVTRVDGLAVDFRYEILGRS